MPNKADYLDEIARRLFRGLHPKDEDTDEQLDFLQNEVEGVIRDLRDEVVRLRAALFAAVDGVGGGDTNVV